MKKNVKVGETDSMEEFLCSLSCKSKKIDPEEGKPSFVDFKT